MLKCKKHPTYKAIKKPIKTNLNPDGCPECLRIWQSKNAKRRIKVGVSKVNPYNSGDVIKVSKNMITIDLYASLCGLLHVGPTVFNRCELDLYE
jgi:hypothetical protein